MSALRSGLVFLWLVILMSSASGDTLSDIKLRGTLNCGVSTGVPGFSNPDDTGKFQGLDADYCRAIAAAIFGNATKVKFVPLSISERFVALQSGEVDVLARNTAWTAQRDVGLGISFAGVNFYDGQAVMIRRSIGVKSLRQLDGAAICIGSELEGANLADYFKRTRQTFEPVVFDSPSEAAAAYGSGRCDALSSDTIALASIRMTLAQPTAHIILPGLVSRTTLYSMAVREGDDQWRDVVTWVHNALLIGEIHGITKANVSKSDVHIAQEARLLLAYTPSDVGANLGLGNKWAFNVIKAVGNYGQIFERHLGAQSTFKLVRGQNALFTKGGLHCPPSL